MTTSHEDIGGDGFQRPVAEMRRLLGVEGNVLAYIESERISDFPPTVAHIRYASTMDSSGTGEASREVTDVEIQREES